VLVQTILKVKEEKKLSYRRLAEEFNCSYSWLNEVVKGVKEPNLDLLRSVARYTGKPYDELMKVHIPIKEDAKIDVQLLRDLFDRSNKQQRHIRPLRNRPSFVEQRVLDNIREVTDFEFSQVTLNYNHQMAPHRHKNKSISIGILLGDFTGGALCVADGSRFEEKNVFFEFDGTKSHHTEIFSGERFSVILYKR
jgi:transcriptional regulator with XRE-family HTH domain